MRLLLSQDAVARALGSEVLADDLARLLPDVPLTRTGSLGAHFAEPCLVVERGDSALLFGPLTRDALARLVASDFPASDPLCLGERDQFDFLARQNRVTFQRVGRIDPLSLTDWRAAGGGKGLARAQQMEPQAIIQEVIASGLRGRGGAGFPAGIKWQTVAGAQGARKFIVCNADEGDSGTFADRMLIEGDPFSLIEGMAIAARACGSSTGFIYLRSEYPDAIRVLREALAIAEAANLTPDFAIELRIGAGAYVCGEETSLLNSLEGKRGVVRAKPPLPALTGLFGAPTVVNNVLTLASVPMILAEGAARYQGLGHNRSRGTMVVQLGGNVRRGGLIEVPFGITLCEIIEDFGQGTASGRPVKAAQVGGPLGAWIPEAQFDTKMGYEEFDAIGALLGHAGVVVADDQANLADMARFAFEFCAIESCGKCTPCRIGAVRGVEVIDQLRAGDQGARALIEDLCATMREGSLCALGGFTPYPVLSALRHFPEDFAPSPERVSP